MSIVISIFFMSYIGNSIAGVTEDRQEAINAALQRKYSVEPLSDPAQKRDYQHKTARLSKEFVEEFNKLDKTCKVWLVLLYKYIQNPAKNEINTKAYMALEQEIQDYQDKSEALKKAPQNNSIVPSHNIWLWEKLQDLESFEACIESLAVQQYTKEKASKAKENASQASPSSDNAVLSFGLFRSCQGSFSQLHEDLSKQRLGVNGWLLNQIKVHPENFYAQLLESKIEVSFDLKMIKSYFQLQRKIYIDMIGNLYKDAREYSCPNILPFFEKYESMISMINSVIQCMEDHCSGKVLSSYFL